MLFNQFKQYIASHHLFRSTDILLLAVSGGIDSVVLCELCHRAGYRFIIAHCNFQLRGGESERDENFVQGLGKKYGVEVLVKKFDTESIAATEKKSIETAARELRYQWFYELLSDQSAINDQRPTASHILTAHHADDNIETAVMNFFRGTGIAGIRGILPKQDKLVRPLLFARRKALEDFVQDNQLAFVTDSTNAANDYTRNFFRNTILPLVAQTYPEASQNVLNNISRFAETATLYQQAIDWHKKKLLEKQGNEFHIPLLKLQKAVPLQSILYEILRDFGFGAHQTSEVIALLSSETGRYIQSSTHRVIKNRQWLIITPNQTNAACNILIEAANSGIEYEGGLLKVEKHPIINFQLSTIHSVAQLDAACIKFPLLLRKWKQGDYFYPLGMQKKKKLSRFFIDQKLSLPQKENAWVVEMDKKIIWVVGMRIDDRFKITGQTTQIITLTFKG